MVLPQIQLADLCAAVLSPYALVTAWLLLLLEFRALAWWSPASVALTRLVGVLLSPCELEDCLHLLAASVRHRSHASGHQAGHIVLLLVVFIVLISLEAWWSCLLAVLSGWAWLKSEVLWHGVQD